MPTAGTHITIIERLALRGEFASLLGDPNATFADPAAKQMRYAKLGAIGPDIFYALMDYGGQLQDLTNFLAKVGGSFECISELTKKIDGFISQVESDETFGLTDIAKKALGEFEGIFRLISAVINEGLLALVIEQGFNFFPVFEARRQQDLERTTWFWADYLHYVRTGVFVRELFERSKHNPNLRAFAYGYLSHYVTDVVGHPFVNQVVGAPWRMYWQRHHLVENFIDAYVWARWHVSLPEPDIGEQPLDHVRPAPNGDLSKGAPFTFARLNDHINIGYPIGNDPVDKLILDICHKINQGLEDIGIAEPEPSPPGDQEFLEWTQMMADAFRSAYPASAKPPENLKGLGRPDGYPRAEDIASAYSVLRLYLRLSTEEKIKEPEFPDIAADVWNAITKVLDDLKNNLGAIPPMPVPGVDPQAGGLSFEDLWEAMKAWVKRVADFAEQIGKAAFQFIKDAIAVAGVLLVDSIRVALYYVKKALFDIYSAFRYYLVRAAYAIPFTDQLYDNLGGNIPGTSVWITHGELSIFTFPLEELPRLERKRIKSNYPPWVPPAALPEMHPRMLYEEPRTWVAPYGGNMTRKLARGGGLVSGSLRFTRGAIVGMKESEESFPDGRGQIRIETEYPVGFAGPFDGTSLQILFDAAGMGGPLSARQMVLAAPEPLRLARGPQRRTVIHGAQDAESGDESHHRTDREGEDGWGDAMAGHRDKRIGHKNDGCHGREMKSNNRQDEQHHGHEAARQDRSA
jgi:hypothetical protein